MEIKMQFTRLFTTTQSKGFENYISSQKKYEMIRTIIYFLISLSLFIAGWIQTGNRMNLLTIVAILGCLPASKSLVSMIMFLRYKSCDKKICQEIQKHNQDFYELYDCVFTSYKINFKVDHLVVRGNTICGFTTSETFDENQFYSHIKDILNLDGHGNVSVKIFKKLNKYIERMDQLKDLESNPQKDQSIIETLKNVML